MFLRKRMQLAEEEINPLSQKICHFASQLIDDQISIVHLFLPIEKKKEVNTYFILESLLKINKKVVLPRVKGNEMESIVYSKDSDLVLSQWNIPEPESGKKILAKALDLVFLPLLAIDKKGQRIGYGKGFYDRLLSQTSKDCKKIGLGFFEPIDQIDDIKEHDISLDSYISPEAVYSFK